MTINITDLKERIALHCGFHPEERDFILDCINECSAPKPTTWQWSCGHIAGAMCQECYHLLAIEARLLAAEAHRLATLESEE